MKLILTNNTTFDLSHINVMKNRSADDNDTATVREHNRIDIVFADSVDFEQIAALDQSLFQSVIIETGEGQMTFDGYAFNSLNQHISDNSKRMTLSLSKQ